MRLFIALPLPEAQVCALLKAQDELRAQGARANFSRRENLHLTLAFLGELEGVAVRDAQEAVLSLKATAFSLTLGRLGNFGDTWWAGLQKSAPLDELAAEVRAALDRRGLPYDRKPFRAHITLARRLQAPAPPRISLPPVTGTVERVVLFRSERIQGQLTYVPVAEERLR